MGQVCPGAGPGGPQLLLGGGGGHLHQWGGHWDRVPGQAHPGAPRGPGDPGALPQALHPAAGAVSRHSLCLCVSVYMYTCIPVWCIITPV